MKYYLIDEVQLENYKLSITYLLQLMEQGKIPKDDKVKKAMKNVISKLNSKEVYIENTFEADD